MAQNQYVHNNYISSNYNDQMAAGLAMPTLSTTTTTTMYGDKTVINPTTNSIQTKSKSKSVPDIVQEINAELQNSQGRRVRNISQSMRFGLLFQIPTNFVFQH